jgi:hypothetical protein
MFLSDLSRRLCEGYSFAAFELSHALTDCGYGFGTLQPVEQRLVAAGILNNKFSPAIDG